MESRSEFSTYNIDEIEALAKTDIASALELYRPKLLHFCEVLCNQSYATKKAFSPDDLCQQVILKALESQKNKAANYRGENFAAWLNVIAKNSLINKLKYLQNLKKREGLSVWGMEEVAGSVPDPESLLLSAERNFKLKQFLKTLNEYQRRIFLLRMSGLKLDEIAERLGVGVSTVTTHIQRIKRKAEKSEIFADLISKK